MGEWKVVGENNKAYRAFKKEEWTVAGERLEQLAVAYPDHERAKVWAFDAALSYKFLRDWPKAYELGRVAASYVERGRQEPAFWNLGIAATVLREWRTARDAWDGYGVGIPLPDGDGPIVLEIGMTPIRLDPGGAAEIVWAERLCPTRARIRSVPLPDSGRRFGEVVVHDGAPNGERIVDGQRFPVFDELVRFEPSDLPTVEMTVEAPTVGDVRALVALFEERGYGAEPANSVNFLCACCSEGSVEQNREYHEAGRQTVWLAAPETEVDLLLSEWQQTGTARRVGRGG